MSWLEILAVSFGLLAVILTIRQHIACWPVGLVQVALYVIIFYQVKLYSDLLLHLVYIVLQFVGWHQWLHGGREREQLVVTRLRAPALAGCVAVALVAAAGWGRLMAAFTDAALPYPDAFIASASLVAQGLMIRKKLESWAFWIVVDLVAIAVYLQKALYPTAGLYALFLVLAILGLRAWRKTLAEDPA